MEIKECMGGLGLNIRVQRCALCKLKPGVPASVLWIRIGFNADPDPVFLSQSGSGSREPNQKGSLSDFKVTQKVEYSG